MVTTCRRECLFQAQTSQGELHIYFNMWHGEWLQVWITCAISVRGRDKLANVCGIIMPQVYIILVLWKWNVVYVENKWVLCFQNWQQAMKYRDMSDSRLTVMLLLAVSDLSMELFSLSITLFSIFLFLKNLLFLSFVM